MSFKLESSTNEDNGYENEILVETPVAEEESLEQEEDENFLFSEKFDDGFDKEPNHIILESEDQIRELENTFNVDISSLISRRNEAA